MSNKYMTTLRFLLCVLSFHFLHAPLHLDSSLLQA